jgi:hypothetical protein
MLDVFAAAGFTHPAITNRYDCFAGTTKESTARRYQVVGANFSATYPVSTSAPLSRSRLS